LLALAAVLLFQNKKAAVAEFHTSFGAAIGVGEKTLPDYS
jgi:hypothetical protein